MGGQTGRPGQYNDPPDIQSSIPEPMAPLQYPLYKQSLGVAPAHYPGSPRYLLFTFVLWFNFVSCLDLLQELLEDWDILQTPSLSTV